VDVEREPDLCRGVVRLLHQAIERYLRGWARSVGENHGRGGGVTVVQRFGGHPRPRYSCHPPFPWTGG
jgi:hypothetical protein